MRKLLFVAAIAAFSLSIARADEAPAPAAAPAAAPTAPMTAAGLPQGVVLISADSFNAVMTVLKAITDLAPELATPQVNKAFGAMRSCAQDNLAAPQPGQDQCPTVSSALVALGAKPAPAPAAATKGKK
jgi:hypothetical protein